MIIYHDYDNIHLFPCVLVTLIVISQAQSYPVPKMFLQFPKIVKNTNNCHLFLEKLQLLSPIVGKTNIIVTYCRNPQQGWPSLRVHWKTSRSQCYCSGTTLPEKRLVMRGLCLNFEIKWWWITPNHYHTIYIYHTFIIITLTLVNVNPNLWQNSVLVMHLPS